MYFDTGKGEGGRVEPERRSEGQQFTELGRKYQHDWRTQEISYLQSINSDNTCRKVPLKVLHDKILHCLLFCISFYCSSHYSGPYGPFGFYANLYEDWPLNLFSSHRFIYLNKYLFHLEFEFLSRTYTRRELWVKEDQAPPPPMSFWIQEKN